ncbi:ras-related protein Rab-3B isoform X2 [Callithrix jacchus]
MRPEPSSSGASASALRRHCADWTRPARSPPRRPAPAPAELSRRQVLPFRRPSESEPAVPHSESADTAGQERYRTITTAYYRGAMGFILMYDITNEESFNAVQDWATQIKTYSWDNAQVILVGNKCDMEEERVVPTEKGRLLAEQLGFDFFEASAKENISVRQAFERLVDAICDKMSDSMDTDPSMLGSSKNTRLSDTPPLLQQNCSC